MSELYREAIVEAKKLKEVAEIDARNKIIEAVTPYIKRIIATEAAGQEINTEAFMFEDGDLPPEPMDDPTMGDVAMPPSPGGPEGMEPGGPMPGDMPTTAPISPLGAPEGSGGLMGSIDPSGGLTMSVADLFTGNFGGIAGAPVGMPPADMSAPPMAGAPSPALPPAGPVEPPPVSPVVPPTAPAGPDASSGMPPAPPVPGAPPAPGMEVPAPVPGEEELPPKPAMAAESKILEFQGDVRLVAEKIDHMYFRGDVPLLVKESLKSKLFNLCEKLDEMVNNDVISSKKARLAENKLEFLFMKLNEAENGTSYKEIIGAPMTTLREFAAKLFEEDALGPATADKATAHAEKVSGIQPGVDLFKESDVQEMAEDLLGEAAPASSAFGDGTEAKGAETVSPKVHDPKALVKKAGAGITEAAPSSTAFGDGAKAKGAENTSPKVHQGKALADEKGANTILEFDEKELREAVEKLRQENTARKLATVKEGAKGAITKSPDLKIKKTPTGDQGSVNPEGKSVAPKIDSTTTLAEDISDLVSSEEEVLPAEETEDSVGLELGSEGETSDNGEVELTFQVSMEDLEKLLSGDGSEEFVATSAGAEEGNEDLGDGEIELTDELEEPAGEEPEGDLLLGGEEPKMEDEALDLSQQDDIKRDQQVRGVQSLNTLRAAPNTQMAGSQPAREIKIDKKTGRPALQEGAVIARAAQAVRSLKTQLSESKLLTAKALYVSKFAVREDLTTKQKQKIAEYFDKANSLLEAKETYTKIRNILSESTTSNKLSGSASRPTSTGSAKLNESAQNSGDQIDKQRWMLLAGIKDKK